MKKRLKIYTFPDKNPEYLQLQIDSFKEHMDDGNTDFIIVNTSTTYSQQIEDICKINNIEVIPYGGVITTFPEYVVEQYAWFRDNIQVNNNDFILLIHSDMFFINKLDYKKLMSNKKFYFNPQYRDTPFYKINNGNFNYFYMWDGVVLFDSEYVNNNNLREHFKWGMIKGVTDVGGETTNLINHLNPNDIGYIEMWTHHELNEGTLISGLNGSVRFTINLNGNIKKIQEGVQMGNKSFPYENDIMDYENYIIEKTIKIKELFIDPFDFENPVHSDWLQVIGHPIEDSPIFHFKSGSMYKDNFKKLNQIKKMIFRNAKKI
jgi:hypothetical protein